MKRTMIVATILLLGAGAVMAQQQVAVQQDNLMRSQAKSLYSVILKMTKGDIPYNQFWLIFGLVAWTLSAASGIVFLGPEAKRLNKVASTQGPQSPEAQARLAT